jgi:hypothetical protein
VSTSIKKLAGMKATDMESWTESFKEVMENLREDELETLDGLIRGLIRAADEKEE